MQAITKRLVLTGAVVATLLLGSGTAWAKPKWKNLGDYTADGQPKEIAVGREISEIAIDFKEGSVIINTVWVREGAAKREYTVGQQKNKGDPTLFIKLDGKRNVTGLRISDKAGGRYRVSVK